MAEQLWKRLDVWYDINICVNQCNQPGKSLNTAIIPLKINIKERVTCSISKIDHIIKLFVQLCSS